MNVTSARARFVLTRMDFSHLDDVLEIERASHASPWSQDAFRHELEGNPFSRPTVATPHDAPERIVGFCVHWVVFDYAHVQNVAVHPSVRRTGLGRYLVERAIADAASAGAESVDLEVRPSNHPARRLYESIGFDVVGARRGYYSSPREDALLLRLPLQRGG